MQQIDLAVVTDKLTANQRNTIESLDGKNFVILGCAEPCAIRLCKDGVRRPALVASIKHPTEGCRAFRLTALGVMVKEALATQAWADDADKEPYRF